MRAAPVALLTAAILVATPTIASAGSDSPTPYDVTAAGVTLPAGQVFRDHGHVNYRATALDGTGEQSFNVHFEALNARSTAAYIGTSFLDFAGAVAAFPAGFCVTWVQVEGFDEHFGEGGQAPECTPRPTPLSPAPPVPGKPVPSKPVIPAPVPEAPEVSVPDGGTPVEAPTSPPATQTPTPAPTPGRELAATGPAPEDVPVAGATPVARTVPSAAPDAAAGTATAADDEGLAATGSNALLVAGGAVVLLAAGIVTVLLSRRSRRA